MNAVTPSAVDPMSDLFVFSKECLVHTPLEGERELTHVSFALPTPMGWTALFCQREPSGKRMTDVGGSLPSLYALVFPHKAFSLSLIKDTLDKYEFDLVTLDELKSNTDKYLLFTKYHGKAMVLKGKKGTFFNPDHALIEIDSLKSSDSSFSDAQFQYPLSYRLFNEIVSRVILQVPDFRASLNISLAFRESDHASIGIILPATGRPCFSVTLSPLLEFHFGANYLWNELLIAVASCLRQRNKAFPGMTRTFNQDLAFLEYLGISVSMPTADWALSSGLFDHKGVHK